MEPVGFSNNDLVWGAEKIFSAIFIKKNPRICRDFLFKTVYLIYCLIIFIVSIL